MREKEKIHEKLVLTLKMIFKGRDVNLIFMHGGCYWFAEMLKKYIPCSEIVFNRKLQHCASYFNNGVYDIRGRIMSDGFFVASAKDIAYMKKHFIPCFDTETVKRNVEKLMGLTV